ncbi:MAG: sulfite exporter TauE/SafE family protein [Sphingobacteriales bacterium]|nr:sulfite exporter TauE/SafE family protein [Sphingobacteriales bacterium]
MNIIAYLASGLIGISLGLIGGGGSILTVPVLVYLFGISPILSTSYSLFIVGSTSLVGAFNNYKEDMVDVKTAFLFGLSSIATVFITRKFIIPAIPNELFTIGGFVVTQNIMTMLLFAILMVAAATAMIKSGAQKAEDQIVEVKDGSGKIIKLLFYGVAIGIVTGILGAGGGFLLIPTLVILMKLPMKKAVGTSLLIIAMNSLLGFTGDLGHFKMDWIFLMEITGIAVAGIFIGGMLAKRIDGSKLKKGFGYFVLVMGFYIIIKEVFLK